MANRNELLDFDLATLAEKLRTRKVSPVEITDAYLQRIAETEPQLNAYITVTARQAREAARAAESEITAGNWRGPLHGAPLALKDLCYTSDVLTTGGSKVLADFVPDEDAGVWMRLRDAGAILLGKTNLHEFAVGGTSNNPHFGPVHNPYDLERIPGGSSGGSAAAVAASSALAAIGTDTRGSIRLPAAFCGCVGLKPTCGRVSRYGVIVDSYTFDHVGPITRTVRDAALMLNVIAGHDHNDVTTSREPVPDFTRLFSGELRGARIGAVRGLADWLEPAVERSFQTALTILRALGATIEDVELPSFRMAGYVSGIITRSEGLDYHLQWLLEAPQLYSDRLRQTLEASMAIPAMTYIRAQRARARMIADAQAALAGRDVLVTPMTAITAPRIGEEEILRPDGSTMPFLDAFVPFTCPFDCTGQPAIAVPCGLSPAGLPMAIQIAGRAFDEAGVLRVAHAYEQVRGPLPAPKI